MTTPKSRDASGKLREQPSPSTAIRALRASAGLTQPAAADLLGYQALTIKRWESGERTPDACQWALYRARVALLLGDDAGALGVLREALQTS